MNNKPEHKPKAHFHICLQENDSKHYHYLFLTIWPVKHDPAKEVVVARFSQRIDEDNWKNIAQIAVLRTPDGKFRKLPRWQGPKAIGMGWTADK